MSLLLLLRRRRILGTAYSQKVLSIATASINAYWPLSDLSGTVIQELASASKNGTYIGSPSLGQSGIGDGGTAIVLNGTSTYGQIGTSAFRTAFNGPEGTICAWAKVAGAGVWTDATERRVVVVRVDANNLVLLRRSTTSNALNAQYVAGAVTKTVVITSSSTDWMHLGVTWNKAADQMIAYFNGAQSGATQTGLGTWAGVPGASTTLLGSASTTPGSVWNGSLAHLAVWNVALSAAQIAQLATV